MVPEGPRVLGLDPQAEGDCVTMGTHHLKAHLHDDTLLSKTPRLLILSLHGTHMSLWGSFNPSHHVKVEGETRPHSVTF